jgi:hypothetical protein
VSTVVALFQAKRIAALSGFEPITNYYSTLLPKAEYHVAKNVTAGSTTRQTVATIYLNSQFL